MIKIYGVVRSRVHRVMWMLEELGLPYGHEDGQALGGDEAVLEAVRPLNPMVKVPVLQDGDVVLAESLGINLYLARAHPSDLSPSSELGWGRAYQWTLWVATEAEAPVFEVVAFHRDVGAARASEAQHLELRAAEDALRRPLEALEAVLAERPFLAGDRFTVADLNVACILAFARAAHVKLEPATRRWLAGCLSRPAAAAVFARVIADGRANDTVGELRTD